jgi:lactase-phlorizin hydrolase
LFTEDEKKLIHGTADFLGINHYTTRIVSNGTNSSPQASYEDDHETFTEFDPSWYQ